MPLVKILAGFDSQPMHGRLSARFGRNVFQEASTQRVVEGRIGTIGFHQMQLDEFEELFVDFVIEARVVFTIKVAELAAYAVKRKVPVRTAVVVAF